MNSLFGRYSASVFLVSASIISFQIVLLQILSFMQWYHFAYMIISIALLGFGTAGTLLVIFKKWLMSRYESVVPFLMTSCGFAILATIPLIQIETLRFDSFLIFGDLSHFLRLSFTYLILFIPFCCGALSLGMIFLKNAKEMGRIYFVNLVGSAAGAAIAPVLMWWIDPERLYVICALFAIFSGAFAARPPIKTPFTILFLISVGFAAYSFINPPELKLSQFKGLKRAMDLPEAKIEYQNSSPYGRLHIVSSPVIRNSHNASLSYDGEVPVQKSIFENGNWKDAIIPYDSWDSLLLFDYTPRAWAYKLLEPKSVLILKGGAFNEGVWAVKKDIQDVVVVEPNEQIIDYFQKQFNNLSQIPSNLEIIRMEPRTFLLSTHATYDIIALPELGTFGGTSGMDAISEDYLLTDDAFINMWDRLNYDGIIKITAWMDYPVKNILRLLITIRKSLNDVGINRPWQHIVAIQNWGTVSVFIKKSKYTEQDLINLREFCKEFSFQPVTFENSENRKLEESSELTDTKYIKLALFEDLDKIYNDYLFKVWPVTDDNPYFHQFLKLNGVGKLKESYNTRTIPFFEIGYLLLWITLVQSVVLSFILILLPLFRRIVPVGGRSYTLLYFGCIGLGYMFTEMTMIQKGILYFGNSVFATSVVIGIMLLFSGFGSYASDLWHISTKELKWIFLAITLILAFYSFFANEFIVNTAKYTFLVKLVLFTVSVAPLAFLMGFPFPKAIKTLNHSNKALIPWALGINGFFSVISTAMALIIAIELGFRWVWTIAALVYAISYLLYRHLDTVKST